ncbi:GyrI-like domain-containing protein [Flavihumibacter petaseus]|uniref:AraC effector-binding domain-containing protein n=1 Tax=Flavihumibacter petaseus NBRC 106054 TaxID=1220578 RepID=A0A0E9N096_9BACT|nr:GyrI-like domain-containing protein [Flavihumibacter petaseus]GAO43203.1 hypothetical protein FPE01S_02_03070 [Flavihumibacter petaseus NBRC 106054]
MSKSVPLRMVYAPQRLLIGKKMAMTLADDQTPVLWRSFMPFRQNIPHRVNEELISLQDYGTMKMDPPDPQAVFTKWAAVEVSAVDNVPEGMEVFTVPAGWYAVFLHRGSNQDTSIFQYIFSAWLPASEYLLDQRPHFEVLGARYRNGDPLSEEEIWIPVKPKCVLT